MRCLCVLLCLAAANVEAQVECAATPFSGMAEIGTASFSPWCVFSNQAGASRVRHLSLGISYQSLSGLKELSTKSVFVLVPWKWGNAGIAYSHFGYEKYNEQLVGVAYSRRLGRNVDAGIKIDYLFSYVDKRPGARQAFFFEGGLLLTLPAGLLWGVQVYNPGGVSRFSSEEGLYIAERYVSALSWKPDDLFLLAIQLERIDGRYRFSAGGEFSYAHLFFFRCGFKAGDNRIYAGAGLHWDFMEVHISYNTRAHWGHTWGVALSTKF